MVERAAAKGRFNGTVVVARNGLILFRRDVGLASLELGVPIDRRTRFRIFSTTKHFTAHAVLLLESEGVLSIDDPAKKFIPEMPDAWGAVTVRHLLTHTSGLPLNEQDLATHALPSQSAMVAAACAAAGERGLGAVPGTTFAYSNAGYTVLGAIVERASGMGYEAFVQARIFRPAGMADTGFDRGAFGRPVAPGSDLGAVVIAGLASGYIGEPGSVCPAVAGVYPIQGAGGIYSTADDLLRYERGLRSGVLLSERVQKRMVEEAFVRPGAGAVGVGLGWFIRERHGLQVVHHSGGTNGFVCDFARVPAAGVCVIVLSNFGFVDPEGLRDEVLEEVFAEGSARGG